MEHTLSPITQTARRRFSRIGIAFSLFFVISYAVQLLLVLLLDGVAPAWRNLPIVVWLISLVPMYLIAFPVFMLLLRPLPEILPTERRLHPRHFFVFFLISYALLYTANLVGSLLNRLTDVILGTSSTATAIDVIASSPLIYTLLFAVVIGPIVEETMFRRLLLPRLLPFGEGYAVLGSALAFSLFHGNLSQILYAFLIGAVLGYVYLRTGRIRYPILLHIAINFCGSVLPMLLLRAVDMEGFEAAAEEGAALPQLLAVLPSLLLLLVYLLLIFAVVGIGLYLTIRHARSFRLAPAEEAIPRSEKRYLLLSVGGILFLLTVLALFVRSYL